MITNILDLSSAKIISSAKRPREGSEDEIPPAKHSCIAPLESKIMELAESILQNYPDLQKKSITLSDVNDTLNYIAQIQQAQEVKKNRHSKRETYLPFNIVISSPTRAYLEVKRSEEDKLKAGGESKFLRIIGIIKDKIAQCAGLKIKQINSREQAVEERIQKIEKLHSYQFDNSKILSDTLEYIPYVDKQGNKQLLSIAEHRGVSLDKLEEIDLKKFINIAIQAAQSVSYLHCKGFLHRDIKPDNYLIKSDQVVLADPSFLIDEKKPHSLSGSPKFISYKALLNLQNSRESDCYALGQTLLELAQKVPLTINNRGVKELKVGNLAILLPSSTEIQSLFDIKMLVEVLNEKTNYSLLSDIQSFELVKVIEAYKGLINALKQHSEIYGLLDLMKNFLLESQRRSKEDFDYVDFATRYQVALNNYPSQEHLIAGLIKTLKEKMAAFNSKVMKIHFPDSLLSQGIENTSNALYSNFLVPQTILAAQNAYKNATAGLYAKFQQVENTLIGTILNHLEDEHHKHPVIMFWNLIYDLRADSPITSEQAEMRLHLINSLIA